MKTRSISLLLVCLFFLLASHRADAQIPRVLSYQGIVTDNTGRPIPDGNHTITFNLYTFPSGGTAIFTETQSDAITRGVLSAMIGSQTAIPGHVQFDSAYFLGISIDGGAELTPRTLLTAAPYALNSAFAQNAFSTATSLYAAHATIADSANALSAGVTGVVRSINDASGDIIITGSGATKVTTSGKTVTINVPPGTGNGIQGVSPGDTSIAVANSSGPIALVSVAKAGISNDKMAANAITNANIQDLAVTVSKIAAPNVTKNYVPSADGNGNVAWQQPILQMPYLALGANLTGSVFTVANTGATGTTIRGLAGVGAGLGIVTNAAIWGDAGVNYFGVVGYSDGGSSSYAGVQGKGNNNSTGVSGVAVAGDGVTGLSTTGRAGFFQITNTSSSAQALEASNAGSGEAVRGFALKDGATGIHGSGYGQNNSIGVLGETFSASAGTGALTGPTGVFGKASSSTPAAWSAGVRGINVSANGNGIGVVGYQAGSGWGVYGETPTGNGVYGKATDGSATNNGVLGETSSPNGAGVKASYVGNGIGNAMQLDNGAIKVSGANKAAFQHTVTAANKITNTQTEIDNPICNGDPNCLLFVTYVVKDLTAFNAGSFKQALGVYYDSGRAKWQILSLNNQTFTTPAYMNVWVVKQ
ncbi:MAG: hypothetical protein Q8896_04280 [Bacteroidota bacterium]|nr:hypothetical protein [Bacteroidota bacterium]MDP4236047.1 hypothetical protein [Bacteroidota bacterium]